MFLSVQLHCALTSHLHIFTPQQADNDDVESLFSPSVHNFDKEDRRTVLRRIGRTITSKVQASALRVLPPMNDTANGMYEDTHNDEPFQCSFGTHETNGIWVNHHDRVGAMMAAIVWVLILYSSLTVLLLAQHQHVPIFVAAFYMTICALALASHAKTTFTDPGAIPTCAVPIRTKDVKFHAMCSQCQTYKPDCAHHCRICDRCVAHMDHHCPWMNNCIGAGNMKHFLLFLVYVWTASALALILFALNYFLCENEYCEFSGIEIQLVRAMTWICVGALLFTTSMLMSITYAVLTGVGTIDRLKKKATNTWHESIEEPVPWTDIFGIAPYWTWLLPIDPIFDNYDRIMGYSTTQRLLRAQSGANPQQSRPSQRQAQQGNQRQSPTTRAGRWSTTVDL
jgi:hypothetical protein